MFEEAPDVSNSTLAFILLIALGLVFSVVFTIVVIGWWIFA